MAELTIQKRRSGTISGAERITGVKNAQAEMLLSRRLNQYQNNYKRAQLKIQLEEYKLEHDARLLTLDNKTNDLEYKKRLYPDSDLSHEEMTVHKLQKYLVRNAEQLCYLDKGLGYNIRNQSSAEKIPAVVATARLTLRRKEILQELEESRLRMYSFLRPDHQNKDADSVIAAEFDDEEEGVLDKALKDNDAMFPEIPDIKARPRTNKRQKTIKEKLKENPVVKQVYETHMQQKQERETSQPNTSPTEILARIARMKPLTKTQMMEEVSKVQDSVGMFNKKIDDVIWQFKEEEFQQGLRFVKDKDAEVNRFMEIKNKRSRGDSSRPKTTPAVTIQHRQILPTYVKRRPLTQRQKRSLLMENLLMDTEKQKESTPTIIRGVPHHTAARLVRHSISAKLQRMTERRSPEMKQSISSAI